MSDERDELREALRDLGYAVFKAIGLLRLAENLGIELKPWVRERQIRDGWKP